MLSLISFIIMLVGTINWFCIGLLQFDFVAGLFGSQSSIFSRIIYVAVGLSAFVMLYNLIANKGKIVFNFKNKQETTDTLTHGKQVALNAEAGEELKPKKETPEDLHKEENNNSQEE